MLEALESRVLLSRSWFVAPGGNDNAQGTISLPFKTIQHAASLAQPSDTVFLRAGTYRETVTPARSGTAAAPITYSAYNNEAVTIDGANLLTGWTKHAGSNTIYTASQPLTLGAGNDEILVNGQAMNEASWPSTAVGATQPATAKINSVYTSALGRGDSFSDTATISVSGLPGGIDAWAGAIIHFGAGQDWTVQTGTVLHSGNGTITFAYQHQTNYETPAAGNTFYLTGKSIALDAAGEWYRDPATGQISLWMSNGGNPASATVEAKARQYAFNLSGRSYLNIRNIRITAATIETNSSSTHLNISGLTASYVSEQMIQPIGWIKGSDTTGIVIEGSNNILQNSSISGSSGNGIFLGGSSNTVQNCMIANTDLSGADEAGITVVGSHDVILSNTIHDTGRDGILDSDAVAADIEHNTIYNIGHQTTDLGAIYDHGTDSHGTLIAYNTISAIHSGGFGGVGIYLDNGSANYTVHDNTITGAQIPIKLNPPSYSNKVYNNRINGKVVASQNSAGGSPAATSATFASSTATFTTLGTLGGFISSGSGINNAGQVVGTSMTGSSSPAFLYANKKLNAVSALGATQSEANAINASGQIVGSEFLTNGHVAAWVDKSGSIQSLGTLAGDVSSIARAINASGQIAGVSFNAGGIGHAFIYTGGKMQAIGSLGGQMSEAFGISDSGVVVGDSTRAGDRDAHAFSWSNGTTKDLGTLGGDSSYAAAINKSGQITGASLIKGDGAFHAFIDTNGVMKDIGTLAGYKNSVATSINAAGAIVGYCYNTDISVSRAFIYRNGVMTDLNKLAPAAGIATWTLQMATSINDSNQITGTAASSDLRSRAYVLALLK